VAAPLLLAAPRPWAICLLWGEWQCCWGWLLLLLLLLFLLLLLILAC
jgi:hypothetical protein